MTGGTPAMKSPFEGNEFFRDSSSLDLLTSLGHEMAERHVVAYISQVPEYFSRRIEALRYEKYKVEGIIHKSGYPTVFDRNNEDAGKYYQAASYSPITDLRQELIKKGIPADFENLERAVAAAVICVTKQMRSVVEAEVEVLMGKE